MYVEVDVVQVVPRTDPAYRKPDIGSLCVMRRKMLLRWRDISLCCMESLYFHDTWTDICTPMGIVTIDMPYKSVIKHLQQGSALHCPSCGIPV